MDITIIGAGKVGAAFARALLNIGVVHKGSLLLIERTEQDAGALEHELGCQVERVPSAAIKPQSVLLLAVKPQDFGVLAPLHRMLRRSNSSFQ